VTIKPILIGVACALTPLVLVGCGSSPTAPSGSIATAILALFEPSSVDWRAPGSSCAAGSASDYAWTDTVSETAGVSVVLTSMSVTMDGSAATPTSVNATVPAKGQATLPREICLPTTSAHTLVSQYSGTDANGHPVTASNTVTLAAKPVPPITQPQISQLASSIATAGQSVLNALLQQLFNLPNSTGTFTLDATESCPGGGTARAHGPVTATADASGENGTVTADFALEYAGCAVGTTVMDGGPLTIKGQLNVVSSAVVNPVMFTITGTHAFTIDGVAGTVTFACDNALTVDQDTITPVSLVATGDASLQFPTGQNPTTAPCATFAAAFGYGSH
jgi:hypothetical protein